MSAVPAGGGAGARPFQIRSLQAEDLPRVLRIEEASFSTPWRESTFRALLLRTDSDLFAAEEGETLLGYAACWTVADQAELGNVAVAPEARGRGIGGALVDRVLERVRERGARECFLEVRESNEGAQSLYRTRRFVVVGRRRAYYSKPREDALVMRVEL